VHAVLYAAGYNTKWMLHMIARKGVSFLWVPFFASGKRWASGRVPVILRRAAARCAVKPLLRCAKDTPVGDWSKRLTAEMNKLLSTNYL